MVDQEAVSHPCAMDVLEWMCHQTVGTAASKLHPSTPLCRHQRGNPRAPCKSLIQEDTRYDFYLYPKHHTVPARGRSRPSYECPALALALRYYALPASTPHYSRCSPPVGGRCSRGVTSPPPSHWESARALLGTAYRINSQQTAARPAGRAVGARRQHPCCLVTQPLRTLAHGGRPAPAAHDMPG